MKEYKISYIDQTERTKATNNTTHQPDKNGPDNQMSFNCNGECMRRGRDEKTVCKQPT